MENKVRVLFVCMGNICRSPSAEGVFRRVLSERAPHLAVEVASAATHDFHSGSPPDQRAIEAARRRGVDLSSLRARHVEARDFEYFDLILAMDDHNVRDLHARAPEHLRQRVRLVMDFAPSAHARAVPDPYYGGPQGFEEVLDLLEEAAAGLLSEVERLHGR
jgi:protein-tyrosine phosphatase